MVQGEAMLPSIHVGRAADRKFEVDKGGSSGVNFPAFSHKLRPTLRQVFGFSLIGLLLGLGALFYLVLDGTERTILQSTPAGARLYHRMGYRPVATIAVYASSQKL